MLGFLLRILPFWVREPLLIVVGSVLGVRILYLALHDDEWIAAAIGAVFLVFTAVRVRSVVRALRARRDPGGSASADGAAAQALPPQRPAPASSRKEPNAWGQAFAAVAVFAAIAGAVWVAPRVLPSDDHTPRPASCPGAEEEEMPKAYAKTSGAVTGPELCRALYRPDLAQLLGTPGERAISASGSSGTAPLTDGKVAQPEAEVTFATYTVNVSATYNELSIGQYVKLLRTGGQGEFEPFTVLGRPAFLSSDHTMKLTIGPSGGGSGGPVEQGPLARTLSVALGRDDRGGYYDITVWSESGALPDDSALVGIAEEVLADIPERSV
ncbi:DUF6215 domain-containing protein [Streptomyces sp. BK79]|uniref:DUF6215 domain-containing protein n=1 Tax=Streptomyces sp. BK79 TaxID=3350097 RepID=UPI00376FB715